MKILVRPVYLEQPVERHPPDQEVWEELQNGEEGEHDPIHEPLCVVLLVRGLQGLDGAVGGVQEPNAVAEQLGPEAEHQPQGGQTNQTWKKKVEISHYWKNHDFDITTR